MRAVGCTVHVCTATVPELLLAIIRNIQFVYVSTITLIRLVEVESQGIDKR